MPNEEGRWRLVMVGEREPLYATPEVLKRVAELDAKANSDVGLTEEEFAEWRGLQDFGGDEAVVEIGDLRDIGVSDPRAGLGNFRKLDHRAQAAIQAGFYIEAISLTLLVLDFGLRGYVLKKTGEPVKEKATFGPLIDRAHGAGLDQNLVTRLRDFNAKRVAGIHHLLLGRINYEDLREPCLAADGLITTVVKATAEDT